MKTEYILLAQYERAIIPLEEICEEYFSCRRHTAIRKAKNGTLPVPSFQTGIGQKSPWMIHISDLATMIDEQRDKAREDWINASE